jgi:hypothetical protein
MALAHCILRKFLGVGCHCFPLPLDVPTFSARCLHVQRRERPVAAEGGTLRRREMFRQISSRIRLPRNSRDLLHAANLRHGTDELEGTDNYVYLGGDFDIIRKCLILIFFLGGGGVKCQEGSNFF